MAGNVAILVITTGRTDYEFYWNILTALVTPAAIYIGALYSPQMIILALGIMQFILLIPGWYMFYHKLIKMKLWPFIKAHTYPLMASSLIFFIAELTTGVNIIWQALFSFILLIALAGYSYFTVSEVRTVFKKYYHKYAWF
jgi:PST family polysaccharide transporter/teichuronic acid exporter